MVKPLSYVRRKKLYSDPISLPPHIMNRRRRQRLFVMHRPTVGHDLSNERSLPYISNLHTFAMWGISFFVGEKNDNRNK